ncbi:hypothetical protein WJX79_004423 [Trebouxia sp. C0005]
MVATAKWASTHFAGVRVHAFDILVTAMYAQDAVVSASWGTSAPVVGNGAAQGVPGQHQTTSETHIAELGEASARQPVDHLTEDCSEKAGKSSNASKIIDDAPFTINDLQSELSSTLSVPHPANDDEWGAEFTASEQDAAEQAAADGDWGDDDFGDFNNAAEQGDDDDFGAFNEAGAEADPSDAPAAQSPESQLQHQQKPASPAVVADTPPPSTLSCLLNTDERELPGIIKQGRLPKDQVLATAGLLGQPTTDGMCPAAPSLNRSRVVTAGWQGSRGDTRLLARLGLSQAGLQDENDALEKALAAKNRWRRKSSSKGLKPVPSEPPKGPLSYLSTVTTASSSEWGSRSLDSLTQQPSDARPFITDKDKLRVGPQQVSEQQRPRTKQAALGADAGQQAASFAQGYSQTSGELFGSSTQQPHRAEIVVAGISIPDLSFMLTTDKLSISSRT